MGRRNDMPDEFLLPIIVLEEAGENSMIRATKILCCVLCLVTQLCPTLCDPMDCSPLGSSVHGDSPGKNTGVGFYALLQGIFPTQGSKPGLPHCRWILYCLSHQGSPPLSKTIDNFRSFPNKLYFSAGWRAGRIWSELETRLLLLTILKHEHTRTGVG